MKDEEISFKDMFRLIKTVLESYKQSTMKNRIMEKIRLYYDLKNELYSYYNPDKAGYIILNAYKFENKKKNKSLNVTYSLGLSINLETYDNYTLMDSDGIGLCWRDTNRWYHNFIDKLIIKECEKRWKCFSIQNHDSIKANEFKYKIGTLVNE